MKADQKRGKSEPRYVVACTGREFGVFDLHNVKADPGWPNSGRAYGARPVDDWWYDSGTAARLVADHLNLVHESERA